MKKKSFILKLKLIFLQNIQIQRDILRKKLVDMNHDFKSLKKSKKESEDKVRYLKKELEDSKISRIGVLAIEDNLIDDLTACEKTLKDKFAHIEGE